MKKAKKIITEQNWEPKYGAVFNEHAFRIVTMSRSTNEPNMPPAWELDALVYGIAAFPGLFRAAVALIEDFKDTNPEELKHSAFKELVKQVKACQAHDKI